jgi:hypothetical protein
MQIKTIGYTALFGTVNEIIVNDETVTVKEIVKNPTKIVFGNPK